MGDRAFDAVLFDWCGTLVGYPNYEERFAPVLAQLGRPHAPADVADLASRWSVAAEHPDAIAADERCDLSAADHLAVKRTIAGLAAVDEVLADAIDASYGDLSTYTTYPEAAEVITELADAGVEIVIVSDFHVDLRPHLASMGVLDRIAGFAISYEVGAIKPDPRMFEAALSFVDAPPDRCLMVGDNPRPDCGAAALGITTLILPIPTGPRPELLRRVLGLVFPM